MGLGVDADPFFDAVSVFFSLSVQSACCRRLLPNLYLSTKPQQQMNPFFGENKKGLAKERI